MHGVVTIRGLDTLYWLDELPDDRGELDLVEEGATVAVPPGLEDFPDGLERRSYPALGRHKDDPKQYRLFRHEEEIEPAGFEPIESFYGGHYSPKQWRWLVKQIPAMRAFAAIPPDPPGVMEEALRYIREGR